jgi:polysaccharide biosynthesis/export protein
LSAEATDVKESNAMKRSNRNLSRATRVMQRSMCRAAVWVALTIALLPAAFGQTAGQAGAPAAPRSASSPSDSRYRIGPGDVLNIQIFNRPQLSRDAVRVDGNGMIRLPWIEGEIRAACRTETEVAAEIIARYRSLLRAPQVGVFIKEYQSQPVAVIGAVNQPGRYQLQRPVRLLELLTFAGGPAERAGRAVNIIHAAPTPYCEQLEKSAVASDAAVAPEAVAAQTAAGAAPPAWGENAADGADGFTSLNLSAVMRGTAEANPLVRPGDIVTLPDAEQIYVVGNVLRPASLPLRGPVTVSQAVAMAGGLLPASKADRVQIVRQTPAGKTEIFVDLKAVEKRGAEDVELQANDIVNVPTAGGKQFVRTLITALAPAVSQLPVQAVR